MLSRVPFNRRLILFFFVVALAGLQTFAKLGAWYLLGTVVFFALLATYWALKAGKPLKPPSPDCTYRPFVSVLIPAHNEQDVIAETVQQAFRLRYHQKGKRNYEVWVIDDRSTDDTPGVIEELKRRFPRLNVLSRKSDAFAGKAAALNQCLPLTNGEVLLIIDADAHFPPDIISKTVGYLAPPKIGGAQVVKRIANPETNTLCQRQSDEYKIDVGIQLGRDEVGGAVEFKGNGSFIKRSALEAVGGWSNYTITEDLDLSTKMLLAGYRIRFVPETCVWEQAAPDNRSFVRQRLRWIEGSMLRYLIHLPRLLKGPLHPRQRFDMIIFLAEFAVPVFVLFDVLYNAVYLATGGSLRLWNFAVLGVVVSGATVFLTIKLLSTFIRERRYTFWQILGRTSATLAYMLLWFPQVIIAIFNLMSGLEARSWKKARRVKTAEIVKA
jgi:1,2-diacylglycerol 3-beta-glucosyltransferase